MQFSIASLGLIAALPAFVSAFSTYNATIHVAAGCGDAEPYAIEGEDYTDCVPLEQTYGSLSAFEDEPTGYCHFFLFSDNACDVEITTYDELHGTCEDITGINSFRVSCYR